jgi:formylglycine-generating enzyme required for sulfatase activity
VNIPWSFWLSKYEVTVSQYAEFLNMAIVAGQIYRDATKAYARENVYSGVPGGAILAVLGPDIQWSISRFVVTGISNHPVQVSWHGALAFAQHYGNDLPTQAEWEKAARGADYDGAGEHRVYPWGNAINGGHANFLASGDPFAEARTPVGFFAGNQTPSGPDMANTYGLYDMVGNLAEWTRTAPTTIENYPQLENLSHAVHGLESPGGRIVKGGNYLDAQASSNLKCYGRADISPTLMNGYGFRVVRRSAAP